MLSITQQEECVESAMTLYILMRSSETLTAIQTPTAAAGLVPAERRLAAKGNRRLAAKQHSTGTSPVVAERWLYYLVRA
jgi:hypothetical protein